MSLLKKNNNAAKHPFHLVEPSPLPILASLFIALNLTYFITTLHRPDLYVQEIRGFLLICLGMVAYTWIIAVNQEERQGCHTVKVQQGFKWGIILFIVSEVMLFVAFFWAFFHVSLNPAVLIGMKWPMSGISIFSWSKVPLINTFFLLSSGISITLAHQLSIYWDAFRLKQIWNTMLKVFIRAKSHQNSWAVFSDNIKLNENTEYAFKKPDWYIIDTIARGVVFLVCQYIEYYFAPFSISDGIYGSVFFMATGLHGLHVIVGLSALYYSLLVRLFSNQRGLLYWAHHVGFEGSIWYWHFVDVVWLILFILVYWWSGH